MPESSLRLPRARELALVAAALLVLGVLFTWPLARHFSTDIAYADRAAPGYERVPLAQGDHLQVYYLFWLFEDSLREGRTPLRDPYQFRYDDHRLFFFLPSLLPLLFVLFSPLGPVAAYNCIVLLSFVLAGLALYALVRLDSEDRWSAFAGACVVALFPYRVGQLAGHVNGMLTFLVPAFLLFLECTLRARRWVGWAVAAGLAFFFAGAMEFHMGYHLSLLLALYLPWRLLFPLARWFGVRAPEPAAPEAGAPLSAHLGVLAGGAGLGVALFGALDRVHHLGAPAGWVVTPACAALAAWALWRSLAGSLVTVLPGPPPAAALARPLAALAPLALYPLGSALAIPNAGKALLAACLSASLWQAVPLLRRLAALRPDAGGVLEARRLAPRLALLGVGVAATLGFLVVVRRLIFAPSIARAGRRFEDVLRFSPRPADLFSPSPAGGEALVYLGLAAVPLALVGAFAYRRARGGPRPGTGFFPAAALVTAILAVGPHLPLLPLYHLCYDAVPLFKFPRVAGRILAVGVVPFALTVAAGVAVVRRRWGARRGAVVGSLLVALLVLDYLPRAAPGLTTLPTSHPVYDRLARELRPGETVLALPIWPGDSAWTSVYLYWTTRYRIAFLNGYSPAAPSDYAGRVFRPLSGMNLGSVARGEHDKLRELGIRFVLFHEDVYPAKVSPFPFALTAARLDESPYLERVAAAPPVRLYRVRDAPAPPAPVSTSPAAALYEAESWVAPPARSADPAASGGAVASLPAGGPRVLAHALGRQAYPPGVYRVVAGFAPTDRARGPVVSLTVRDAAGGQVLGVSAPGRAGAGPEIGADVALSEPAALAVEVATDGSAPASWDFVAVRFAARPDPEPVVEIEELAHIGRTIGDTAASGGRAVRMIPGYHPRDRVFAGPDRVLPAGRWVARLVLRAPGVNRGAAERFAVGIPGVAAPLASAPLPSGGDDAGYRALEVPFALARPTPVRFSADFQGWRELTLDRIELVPAPR